MDDYKTKLKIVLENRLDRKATDDEISNAETDVALIVQVLSKDLTDLQERVFILEKK